MKDTALQDMTLLVRHCLSSQMAQYAVRCIVYEPIEDVHLLGSIEQTKADRVIYGLHTDGCP